MLKRALVCLSLLGAAACGSSSPASPSSSSTTSSAVSSFAISNQQVTMTSNVVSFSWTGTATSYKMIVATSSGGSDLVNADVTGTSYTWTAPRTSSIYYARVVPITGGTQGTASTELPIFTIDMRNVIDALFFGYGPMSDAGSNPPASSVAMWADGATINTVITDESGDVSLQAARAFVADYLAASSNFISVPISTTSTRYTGASLFSIPLNTVIIRVDNSLCNTTGVIACAYYGPLPYGTGRSFVNLNLAPSPGVTGGSVAIAHEIGHAFGLHHLVQNSSGRAEFKFLMNPTLVSGVLSEVEKTAIAVVRAAGMKQGWTRAQAQAAGLVF